jgi:hypothetical protein
MSAMALTRAATNAIVTLIMAIALDTLAYARRLREAGFSETQADGQAQALAAAMTDTLATKQDLSELNARIDTRFAEADARFARLESRFDYFEKHFDSRLDELERRWELRLDGRLADLERRVTVRMLAGIAAVSALVKLL